MKNIIDPLSEHIEEAILKNENFSKLWNIEIVTENKIVTLRGAVTSKKLADLAAGIAKEVKGVKSVINELKIDETLNEDKEPRIEHQYYVPPTRY